jgi:predicted secreted hydrolase
MFRLLWLLLIISISACDSSDQDKLQTSSLSVSRVMSSTPDPGFSRADKVRNFEFPQDHAAHPDYATEWWYFTGNLKSTTNEQLGYQLTLFRIGLSPEPIKTDSSWRSNQLYMGHLAVSDIDQRQHYSDEIFSREANGLAGAETFPLKIWLGPWSIQGGKNDLFPIHLSAANNEIAIDLSLNTSAKPLVLQGEQGLSQKGAEAGNASYYYSYTRLPTQGVISIGPRKLNVKGNSWFDREWSSSALSNDQQGWDWFSLQLDDQSEIMFYQLRDKQGHAQSFSDGVLVDRNGNSHKLTLQNTRLKPLSTWQNPQNVSYPVSWSLKIPEHNIDILVEAAFEDQEMRHSVHYWEGAVVVSGSHSGKGYLELSGYVK